MDISTIVGVVAALVIVFTVQILEGGSPSSIILIPSILLVFGGATLGCADARRYFATSER